MSNISGFLKTEKKNRIMIAGPATRNFIVPDGISEIEVHVFGGGGNSTCCHAGGGGGGYATAVVNVTSGDTVTLTAGAPAGTSSVTIPTQSPTSPISATGGSCQTGGTGTVTLAPPQPTGGCYTASGGAGGYGCYSGNMCGSGGGGGSAGSPFGDGRTGGQGAIGPFTSGAGGSSLLERGKAAGNTPTGSAGGQALYNPNWFSIRNDNIVGEGGRGALAVCPTTATPQSGTAGGAFAGGGAGVKPNPTVTGSPGAPGGFGGGGAGGGTACPTFTPGVGGENTGGSGLVVIYY